MSLVWVAKSGSFGHYHGAKGPLAGCLSSNGLIRKSRDRPGAIWAAIVHVPWPCAPDIFVVEV